MIRVTIELLSAVDAQRNRTLGTLEIANDGTGSKELGNYDATLHAEYTPPEGRKARVINFRRQKQSVWTLVGAVLKRCGHTKL